MTVDRVEFAPAARADLTDVLEYIEARNPTAAADILAKIDATLVTLQTGEPCRQSFVHPVTLYYERRPGVLRVLRVYHHAREPIAP